MEKFTDKELRKFGNIEKIQQHQETQLSSRMTQINTQLSDLGADISRSSTDLDTLLNQAESLLSNQDVPVSNTRITEISQKIAVTAAEESQISQSIERWAPLKKIELGENWTQFTQNLSSYAEHEKIDLTTDPLTDLLSPNERTALLEKINQDFGYRKAHCDKYDYTLATISGVASGLIDIIFIGGSNDGKLKGTQDERGKLSKSTNSWYKEIVLKYAQVDYKLRRLTGSHIPNFPKQNPANITQAVHYLEMQYKVPYDAQFDSRLNNVNRGQLGMSALNHHLKSLAHYPDLIGLTFSILNQFTNTGTYISNGRIITASMSNNNFELQGNTFIAKIFCGFVNWIGHLASDAVGSSGAVQNGHRGSGLPVPGTEIFQLLNFEIPKTEGETFSMLCTKVFEGGYDARHATAAKIPVIINDLLTRLLWALKQYFYHQKPVNEIAQIRNIPELNRMLFCSYGVFAGLDLGDSIAHGAKSPSKITALYETFSHLNIALYPRLALQAYKEVLSWYNNKHYNVEEFDTYLGQEWARLASF